MPIYEYHCSTCNTKFEALRSIKDSDVPIVCIHCQSTRTKRVQSACYTKTNSLKSTASTSGCTGCGGGSCSSCSH